MDEQVVDEPPGVFGAPSLRRSGALGRDVGCGGAGLRHCASMTAPDDMREVPRSGGGPGRPVLVSRRGRTR